MWEDEWYLEPGSQDEDDGCVWGAERVLVVIVNNRSDWDRVRQEGWYRIPLARAPRRIGAEYLAFYHSQALGETRWRIGHYAPIRRYCLVPRRQILPAEADHPRADALYYKVEVGPVQRLARPVPARRLRRVTFIMTTMAKLLAAGEINDLWLSNSPSERAYRALRFGEPAMVYGAA